MATEAEEEEEEEERNERPFRNFPSSPTTSTTYDNGQDNLYSTTTGPDARNMLVVVSYFQQ